MYPLIADAGDLTVLRSLAAFAYGKWDVAWPESVPDDQRPELPDGRDFGYAAKLRDEPGRMGRRFVRADVSITAAEYTPEGEVIPYSGFSDVEDVLDDAASRTDGDAFPEASISREGLGGLRPRVDFDVGDIVPLLKWGKTLSAPVRSIEDVVELGRVVDWNVLVGGELVSDSDAREQQIRALTRDIAAERREAAAELSEVRETAARAVSTAQAAARDVDALQAEVDRLALVSADGKSTNFYGASVPENPQEGDTWFKPDTDGQVKIFIYGPDDSGVLGWREATPELDFSEAEQKLKANEEAVQAALGAVADAQADVEKVRAALEGKVDTSAFDAAVAAREQALAGLQKELGSLDSATSVLSGQLKEAQAALASNSKDLVDAQASIDAANKSLASTKAELEASIADKTQALALESGMLQPGNLVWNPRFQENMAGWMFNNNLPKTLHSTGGYRDVFVRCTFGKGNSSSIYNAYNDPAHMVISGKDHAYHLNLRVRPQKDLPAGALEMFMWDGTTILSPQIKAGGWFKWEGTSTLSADELPYKYTWFTVRATNTMPEGTVVDICEPSVVEAGGEWLVVDGAITARKVAADAIEAGHVKAGAITAGKIASGAVTAGTIAAGAVTAGKLAAKSVTSDSIAAGAVTAGKIGANSVTANAIAANAVTSNALSAGAVTAGKIAAGAVIAGKIASNAVTADNIRAGAVGAREIAANSINATHIVLAQPGNLIANGSLAKGGVGWDSSLTFHEVANQTTPPNGRYLMTKAGQGQIDAHGKENWFDVQPGASYAFEIWLYANKPNSNFYIECRNQEGAHAGRAGAVVNEGDLWTGGGQYLVNNRTLATQWKRYSCVYTMNADTTRARLAGFYFNHANGSERNAKVAFGGVSLRPMADASLIVDGSVTAKEIAAGSITGTEIKSGSITSKEIAAGTITAGNIKSGELTSDNVTIKNGAITNAMIKDLAVTNAKIANGTIQAAKIGSVDAGTITAGTLDSGRIAANSISAQKLQITPGNLFPDPHFQDPCWKGLYSTGYNGSIELKGKGAQSGLYYQPAGVTKDTALKVEPGAVYRLTTHARFSGTAGVTFVSVYCRYVNSAGDTKILKVGQIPRTNLVSYKIGSVSTNLTFPTDMKSGECTIGFFVERSHPDGSVSLWDMQLVRAADASLIVDGSIQGRHIQANSINGDRIVAGTLDAKAIKAGTITATQVNAEDILLTKDGDASLKAQWDELSSDTNVLQTEMVKLANQLYAYRSDRVGFAYCASYDKEVKGSDYVTSLFRIEGRNLVPVSGWKGRVFIISNDLLGGDSKISLSYHEISGDSKELKSVLSNQNVLLYEVDPFKAIPYTVEIFTDWTLPRSTWATVPDTTMGVPEGGSSISVSGTVYFTAVNRGSQYGIRILRNGTPVWTWTSTTFGPLGPLGEKTWSRNISYFGSARVDDKIEVQMYSSAPNANQRIVTSETSVVVTAYTSV